MSYTTGYDLKWGIYRTGCGLRTAQLKLIKYSLLYLRSRLKVENMQWLAMAYKAVYPPTLHIHFVTLTILHHRWLQHALTTNRSHRRRCKHLKCMAMSDPTKRRRNSLLLQNEITLISSLPLKEKSPTGHNYDWFRKLSFSHLPNKRRLDWFDYCSSW